MMPTPLEQLEAERDRLKSEIARIGDMRPGSLVGRFRKCGKPTCHCAESDSEGHGPSWSLTHAVAGKTITKVIPAGAAVERAREQIAEYRRFRKLTRRLVEVSEWICDYGLSEAKGEVGGKKNGARRRPRGRRPRRD